MTDYDRFLRDGFELSSDRHQEQIQKLVDQKLCSIETVQSAECPFCDSQIPVEDLKPADGDCRSCERLVELNEVEISPTELVRIDRDETYTAIRSQSKSDVTELPYAEKSSIKYRSEEFEYRFHLKNQSEESLYQAQLIFDIPSDTAIQSMRLLSYPILTILADSALTKKHLFEQYDLPYLTLGEVAESTDAELLSELRKADQDNRIEHVDQRVLIADDWCTNRQDLLDMGWYEFEHAVQAFLDKLFIRSRLLGGTEAGQEVPDGVMGFTINDRRFRYLWDAKYVKFDSEKSSEAKKQPYVPIADGESHSLSSEYRKVADHARSFMNDQKVDLDGVLLISPDIPEHQLGNLQQKLTELIDTRAWGGKTILMTLDALVGLYRGFDKDRSDVTSKLGFFIESIVDHLDQKNLHHDSKEIMDAEGVIKFGIDDVESIFKELETVSPEHEIPEYQVYVSRSRRR